MWLFGGDLREFAQEAGREQADDSPAGVVAAETVVNAQIEAQRTYEKLMFLWFTLVVFWGGLFCLIVVDVLSNLFFRTPLLLCLFGIAVVNRHGEPAGRARLFWRSVVTWAVPLVGAIATFAMSAFATGNPRGTAITCAVQAVIAVVLGLAIWYAVRHPERGWQDKIAGTWLVPR